jgi:hypothetical protein
MAASSSDKFKKGARKWVGQVGSSGVSDAVVTTIPLSSSTGLPTDTGVVAVIDRVDSSGTKTPSLEETVIGVVSGDSLVTCTRGAEGTAQAHLAGAVVEILITNKAWNDIIDGILVGHNQDGTHKSGSVLTLPQINDTSSDHQYVYSVCELTADRTVALPLLTADDTFVFRNHDNVVVKFNAPEGFVTNGKIVPSVASNNLTVAIKGMDGNDPSASNPVYVRIGDTIRSITSALSVTKNAGTNYFNAGSSELATKEIDYFVYIGYNATDGVTIGFSRIPYSTRYDGFSTTATAETYCAISTIANAAAGDTYQVVGRFAATLSAGAGYTWSVPTFTTTNLIQRPIYETRWLTSGAPTYIGLDNGSGGAPTTTNFRYKIDNRTVTVHIMGNGTKDGTDASWDITNPIMAPANTSDNSGVGVANGYNSSDSVSLVMATKFISPKFYFSNSANITDNKTISSWGSTFSWEI